MDARASIPVTLPRDNPTTPFWQESPDAAVADLQSTPQLPAEVDVVIVGSGITGASVAWHLLDPSPSSPSSSPSPPTVLMLEARQAASGATGRNGGHTKAASYRSFLDHAAAHGTAAAVQIARLELAAIRAVHGLARSEAIACDSCPCDTLDVIYDAPQWARAQASIAAMRAAMPAGDPAAEYALYSRDQALSALCCSDDGSRPIAGVVKYAAGSVSAYRFTVGILKRCLARGLNLQTGTPVLSVQRESDASATTTTTRRWLVATARGVVAARDVVLATNAYTAFLVPALQGVVVPLRGQIAMHHPGASMPKDGLDTTYSFIYDQGYEYMIARPPGSACAGDIIIGGGLKYAGGDGSLEGSSEGSSEGAPEVTEDTSDTPGLCEYGTTDDTVLNPAVSAYLREAPVRYFGRDHWGADVHPEGRVRAEWTGIMGYTPDGYPMVGSLPKNMPGNKPREAATKEDKDKDDKDNNGLWLCCAFQGHGMVYSWPCGQAVAAMVQGRDDAALQAWFPSCFRVSEARLKARFQGRLHTSAKQPK